MEMNGEQIIKNAKKTPRGIKIAYVIFILAIVIASVVMTKREETETPEPIDFTTNGAVGMAAEKYAFLNVEGLTEEVAIYGDTENENSSTNDRYYIAFNNGYMYIVDLNFETIDQLKALQEYTYSEDENAVQPEPVKIYGMTESIPAELEKMVLDYYNESVSEENRISSEEFELYFGSALLNVRRSAVDTSTEMMVIIISIAALFVVVVIHISNRLSANRINKYIKANGYQEEIAKQLDDFVEEKHYKDKVILTKDFLVDTKNSFFAIKYSDIKWIHMHTVKQYGVLTVSTSLMIYLKDGKTRFQCMVINGNQTDEYLQIFNKICEKLPSDALVGYTQENINAYKEYKRETKTM